MFGIGGFELFLILLFGFLIFGPDKLPVMAKTLGKWIAKFRTAQQEMSDVLKNDVFDPDSDEPFKDPTEAVNKIVEKTSSTFSGSKKKAAAVVEKAEGSASAGSAPAKEVATGSERKESFTERKARYERERAAKKAAEESEGEKAAPSDENDADTSAKGA